MTQPQWTRLTREQAHLVLDQLSIRPDAVVFSKDATDVSWRQLPFYKTYKLYKVSNYATMPVFTMKYFSNGEEYIAVDGTATPVYTVNEKDPLQLTDANIVDYLEFFFNNVQGGDGDVFIIKDPRKTPFVDTLDRGQQQVIMEKFRPLDVAHNALGFVVSGTLYYAGSLMRASITVTPNGKISFEDQALLVSGVHIPEHHSFLETT